VRLIDLNHFGVRRAVGAWQVDDALVDCGPTSSVGALLDALAGWQPRRLLLTHIHLDHAGAAGTLARQWPELEIYVHERGARHLVDPSRLNASVRRLYGELTDALWGEVEPVPGERLRPLTGGERLRGFETSYTPGHASHHMAFLHESGRAFVGDLAGVRIEPCDLVVPHAPPPDIDLEAWDTSIDRVRAWKPTSLALPHFGVADQPEAHLDELEEQLHEAADFAREHDVDAYVERSARRLEGLSDEPLAAYCHAAPPVHSHAGLVRYWEKAREASERT
jgi:glyoxylase-like metal-dependent hydrolase (beta-lactamase superfamily II)